MKRLLIAVALLSALLPLSPASAGSRAYVGSGDGVIWCPVDNAPCLGGLQNIAISGNVTVSVFDDVHGTMIGASLQAIHNDEIASGDPLVPPRVTLRYAGVEQSMSPLAHGPSTCSFGACVLRTA